MDGRARGLGISHPATDVSTADHFCDRVPGVREAIRQRMAECPEYREWLEQFGQGVLHAVQEAPEPAGMTA